MVLLGIAGYVVEYVLGVRNAFIIGVLAGLLLAPVVPAPTSCGIPSRPRGDAPGPDGDPAPGTDERNG